MSCRRLRISSAKCFSARSNRTDRRRLQVVTWPQGHTSIRERKTISLGSQKDGYEERLRESRFEAKQGKSQHILCKPLHRLLAWAQNKGFDLQYLGETA